MPGVNCAFPESTVSRTAKYQGIFQIPILSQFKDGTKLSENVYLLGRFTYVSDILKHFKASNLQVRKNLKIFFSFWIQPGGYKIITIFLACVFAY